MFEEKLQEWYKNYLKEYLVIYSSEDTKIYVVKDINDRVDIARVFKIGNSVNISIDFEGLPFKGGVAEITSFALIAFNLGKEIA